VLIDRANEGDQARARARALGSEPAAPPYSNRAKRCDGSAARCRKLDLIFLSYT